MLLPFRPRPKENELLSSWLVRLARVYGMGIGDFLSSTEIGGYIRSSDCDRIQSAGLVNQLRECTGTDRKTIERTFFDCPRQITIFGWPTVASCELVMADSARPL